MANDLQFGKERLRSFRWIHDLVFVHDGDRIVVDGTPQLHGYQGQTAKRIIGDLKELLDGRRSLREISRLLSYVDSEALSEAVSMLHARGVVEAVHELDLPRGEAPVEATAFLRRNLSYTRINGCVEETLSKLSSATIILYAVDSNRQQIHGLQSLLNSMGIADTRILDDFHPSLIWEAFKGQRTIVVTASTIASAHGVDRGMVSVFGQGISWLRVVIDHPQGFFELGPMMDGSYSHSYCADCFWAPIEDAQVSNTERDVGSPYYWCALTALEIVYAITELAPSRVIDCRVRYRTNGQPEATIQMSGFCRCGSEGLTHNGGPVDKSLPTVSTLETVLLFEEAVRKREALSPSAPGTSYSSSGDAQTKRLAHSKRVELPHQSLFMKGAGNSVPTHSISSVPPDASLHTLGTLLELTAGFRKRGIETGRNERWTATAGNLGSVEIFVEVNEVIGLAPGLYFYQSHDHSLAEVIPKRSTESAEHDALLKNRCNAFTMYFTGAFIRLHRKYRIFALRLINLDSGVAMAQSRSVASALGLYCPSSLLWDDELVSRKLALLPYEEQLTGIISFRNPGHQPGMPAADGVMTNSGYQRFEAEPFAAPTTGSISRRLFEQSSFSAYTYSRLRDKTSNAEPAPAPSSENCISVNASIEQKRSLAGMVHRRTVRHYTDDPVTLSQISMMLSQVISADVADWAIEPFLLKPLNYTIIARQITGLDPGIYKYCCEDGIFTKVSKLPTDSQLRTLYIQEDFGSAAAAIWITATLLDWSSRSTAAIEHRLLMLRAGAAAQRFWLRGMELGLDGAIVAGISPMNLHTVFNQNSRCTIPLVAFTTGYGGDLSTSVKRGKS